MLSKAYCHARLQATASTVFASVPSCSCGKIRIPSMTRKSLRGRPLVWVKQAASASTGQQDNRGWRNTPAQDWFNHRRRVGSTWAQASLQRSVAGCVHGFSPTGYRTQHRSPKRHFDFLPPRQLLTITPSTVLLSPPAMPDRLGPVGRPQLKTIKAPHPNKGTHCQCFE